MFGGSKAKKNYVKARKKQKNKEKATILSAKWRKVTTVVCLEDAASSESMDFLWVNGKKKD